MICPHCARTIREEQRYLMSRSPDGGLVWPGWAVRAAMTLLAGLLVVATIALAH